ncbi:hypothetical protein GCM10027447_04130 [Glycomyces halotolerans]
MTYPPPGGYDPQQYPPGSQPPPPPNDPYSQGYHSAPQPPPNYEFGQPPQYGQQPPNMTPPVGVQPGYPTQPGQVMPPPLPPAKQGGNLGIILVVIVGLVVILGVAAVLLVPGMLDDESGQAGSTTSETSEAEPEESEAGEPEEPTESDEPADSGGEPGAYDGWGEPVNADDYDPNTPEGVAIDWALAADSGDIAAMEGLMCSEPSDMLEWEVDYYEDTGATDYGWLIWGMSREVDGQIQAWANWTFDDAAPNEDNAGVYSALVMVDEGGAWKACDVVYF